MFLNIMRNNIFQNLVIKNTKSMHKIKSCTNRVIVAVVAMLIGMSQNFVTAITTDVKKTDTNASSTVSKKDENKGAVWITLASLGIECGIIALLFYYNVGGIADLFTDSHLKNWIDEVKHDQDLCGENIRITEERIDALEEELSRMIAENEVLLRNLRSKKSQLQLAQIKKEELKHE